jgi:hypothetical protein
VSQPELLSRVVRTLDDLGVDYMVTGSYASSIHGEPRLTHDIDLVVALTPVDADRLLTMFPDTEFYLSPEAVRDAIARRRMFNLLEMKTGDKVDFWILTDDPFDVSRFRRKRLAEAWGLKLKVSAPEDTILAKLRWAREYGGSEKQFADALRIYEVQGSRLDMAYLEEWSQGLNVSDLWERLKAEATPS